MSLKSHPFAVEAFFESSMVLTYAFPKEQLENMIPRCVHLDTFQDKWAFVAVAIVQTKSLRPKGFPAFLGNDFILAGYRIFVRYTDERGKSLRGLYILKSETNEAKMTFLGNLFTHYNYTTTDIFYTTKEDQITVQSIKSEIDIAAQKNVPEVSLPVRSPFADWKEARRFAGPLPFTFQYDKAKKEVLIIEGIRNNWIPKALLVEKAELLFLKQEKFKGAILANAFIVENIPYSWAKGKVEKWKGE